jgi:hypothetical protein
VIEELDVKHGPGFIDDRIAAAIRDVVSRNRDKLAWDFARTLSRRLPVPKLGSTFELGVRGGEVSVGANELRLTIELGARLESRTEPRKVEQRFAAHAAR